MTPARLFSRRSDVLRQEQQEPPKRKSFHDIGDEQPEGEEKEEGQEGQDGEGAQRQAQSSAQRYVSWIVAGLVAGLGVFGLVKLYAWYNKEEGTTAEVFRKMFTFGLADPIVEKLLPDVDTQQDPRAAIKPVLVINVDDLLVHLDFKPERGWKCQKRPGVDEFLKQMMQHYEVVFFCDGSAGRMATITMKLDPSGRHIHKLFKEHTTAKDGHHVKDLQKLNRPLQRVILLDHNAGAYSMQPENAIRTYKWTGDTTDDFLARVTPVLVTLARYNAQMQGQVDLRQALKHYKPSEKQDQVADASDVIARFHELIEKQRQAMVQQQMAAAQKGGAAAAQIQQQQQANGSQQPAQKKSWLGLW